MSHRNSIGVAFETYPEMLYPNISYPIKKGWIGDIFARESLTPTGFPTIYTEANTGGGSGAMNASGFYLLTTTANAGDDVDLRMSGLSFSLDVASTTMHTLRGVVPTIDFWTTFRVPTITSVEGFIGWMGASYAQMTVLPTTARHLGVYWDISAGANFIISSSNGTTQVTTDTLVPVAGADFILHIQQSDTNTALVELYNNSLALQKSQSVTAYGTVNSSHHWFVQGETAARTLRIYNWFAKIT